MPSTSQVLSLYTSLTAFAVLIRAVLREFQTIVNQLLPAEIRRKILSKLGGLFGNSAAYSVLAINEYYCGHNRNEIFDAAQIYLSTKISPSSDRVNVAKGPREKSLSFLISRNAKITDTFEGTEFIWEFHVHDSENKNSNMKNYNSMAMERRSFELTFNKNDREMVFGSYLPFVQERSRAIAEENKSINICSLGHWNGEATLDHPSTFETLAMDPELKKELIEDLDRFLRRKDYYRSVGKAWKRGYLLYGPPGTGKSSLIAAMANYLKFDIYDLELSYLDCRSSNLQSLLLSTRNRSIIVIEDIDCSNKVQDRYTQNQSDDENKSKLSNIMNFIDGLWSCCGDERIIVFTTNHKDRLDPALLRPGRMDMHIHMSYCTPGRFRVLASNYHGLKDHLKFNEIDKLITEVDVTPAEVAEELMKSEQADVALEGLVKFMHQKKMVGDELKVKGDAEMSQHITEFRKKEMNNKKRHDPTPIPIRGVKYRAPPPPQELYGGGDPYGDEYFF